MPVANISKLHNAALVAEMLSKGLSQKEIAQKLAEHYQKDEAFTKGYISTLVKLAVDNDWLETKPVLKRHNIPENYLKSLDTFSTETKVLERFHRNQLTAVKINDFSVSGGEGFDSVIESFFQLVKGPNLMGVSRGKTLLCMADAIKKNSLSFQKYKYKNLRAFPTSADFYNHESSYHSSRIAAHFIDYFSEKGSGEEPRMNLFASFIPLDMDTVKKLRMSNSHYGEIFGNGLDDENCLIHKMDTFVTSVSGISETYGGRQLFDEALSVVKQNNNDFPLGFEHFVGDIGGALITESEVENIMTREETYKAMDIYYQHMNNISFRSIKSLAKRAAENHQVNGVVVVACGKNKGRITKALLQRGLINKLICDSHIAEYILAE